MTGKQEGPVARFVAGAIFFVVLGLGVWFKFLDDPIPFILGAVLLFGIWIGYTARR